MDTPPPTPPETAKRKSIFHLAATLSVMTPVAFVLLNVLAALVARGMGGVRAQPWLLAEMAFETVIVLFGVGTGVVALLGMPRHGRKGILGKALCGILLACVMWLLTVPGMIKTAAAMTRVGVENVESLP